LEKVENQMQIRKGCAT